MFASAAAPSPAPGLSSVFLLYAANHSSEGMIRTQADSWRSVRSIVANRGPAPQGARQDGIDLARPESLPGGALRRGDVRHGRARVFHNGS